MTTAELEAAIVRLEAKLDLALRAKPRRATAEAVSLSRAASILGVSRCRTLPALVASGALRTVTIAGRTRVPRAELERLLAQGEPVQVEEPKAEPRRRRTVEEQASDILKIEI